MRSLYSSSVIAVLFLAALIFGNSPAHASTTNVRTEVVTVSVTSVAESKRETSAEHWAHIAHLEHLAYLRDHRTVTYTTSYSHSYSGGFPSYGTYSYSQLEAVWIWAGGPAWAAPEMATIAQRCESGGRTWAYNPSGASGLWQILGVPFPGNPMDGPTNARMAVAKFEAAGDSYGPWSSDGCV